MDVQPADYQSMADKTNAFREKESSLTSVSDAIDNDETTVVLDRITGRLPPVSNLSRKPGNVLRMFK